MGLILDNSYIAGSIKYLFARSFKAVDKILPGKIADNGMDFPELEGSKVVGVVESLYGGIKANVSNIYRNAKTSEMVEGSVSEFSIFPVKAICVVIIAAVMTNVGLSLIFSREIAAWGWMMRILFLLTGIAGLKVRGNWKSVKKNSLFMNKVLRGSEGKDKSIKGDRKA